MTFSYSPDGATDKDKVRLLIRDTKESGAVFSNEEITFLLEEFGPDIYAVALSCVDLMIGQFARAADSKGVGPLSLSYASRIKNLETMRKAIEKLALKKGGAPMPYAGGISIADKLIDEQNPDLFHGFKVGMMDNPGGADQDDLTALRDRHHGWGE